MVALRAALVSLLVCGLLITLFRSALKNWDSATILTTAVLVLFFTYGHVYNYLKGVDSGGINIDRHRILAPVWLVALLLFLVWLARKKPNLSRWHFYLNLIAIIALVAPISQIGLYGFRAQAAAGETNALTSTANLALTPGAAPPDVYYIILDAYTRDDTLLDAYGLDNTPFLKRLEQLDFYVAYCSQSNYAQTQLSLASSLNFDYLDVLSQHYNPQNKTRVGVHEFIRHGKVRQIFENLGYQTIAFETGFKGTEWDDADVFLSPSSAAVGELQMGAGLNGFELLLLNNSAGILLTDAAAKLPNFLKPDIDNPRRIHRERILYALDQLSKLPALPGPKFVFAHLVIPHPPYVFGPDGEFTDYDQEDMAAYRDQVIYLNKRIIPLLETVIRESEVPPIIILQADHGGIELPARGRMEILNAYYLPNGGSEGLYEHVSPVNTFRMVFNQYFGGDYELLEDVSYFSAYYTPFDYTVIPNIRPDCQVD